MFVTICQTQKLRYQSLTKTRRYVYQGKLHTRQTSRVIVSGAEAIEQHERENRFAVTSHAYVMFVNYKVNDAFQIPIVYVLKSVLLDLL